MVLTKKKWDDKTFDGWDLVLAGHIHKPQVIWTTNKTRGYMMGSPIHQTAGDIGTVMGYYLIGSNGEVDFKPAPKEFPRFKRGEPKNNKDYWIPQADEVLDIETEDIVSGFNIKDNSRKELAIKYLMEKGITSKLKKQTLIKILNNAE
jgi:DNA repair exonuclease SbcCD nuclease subunit